MHNYILKNISLADNKIIDTQLRDAAIGKGTVSKLYRMLCHTFFECNVSIRAQWERDLGVPLTAEQWEAILSRSNYLSSCVRYKVIQLKILFRSYITPHKLKKMNCNVSDMCWHGCGSTGTLMHQLWHCPEVKKKFG